MKTYISILVSMLLVVTAFSQQFRLVGNPSGFPSQVNDSTYTLSVNFASDQTGNGFLPTQINSTFRMFFQNEKIYQVDSIANATFSSADLWLVEYDGTDGQPSGQGIVYDPMDSKLIPQTPANSSGASPLLNAAIFTANLEFSESSSIPANHIAFGSSDSSSLTSFDRIRKSQWGLTVGDADPLFFWPEPMFSVVGDQHAGQMMWSQHESRGITQLFLGNGPLWNYSYTSDGPSKEHLVVIESVGDTVGNNPPYSWKALGNSTRVEPYGQKWGNITSNGMFLVLGKDSGKTEYDPIGIGYRTRVPFWVMPALDSGEDSILMKSEDGIPLRLYVEDIAEFAGTVEMNGLSSSTGDSLLVVDGAGNVGYAPKSGMASVDLIPAKELVFGRADSLGITSDTSLKINSYGLQIGDFDPVWYWPKPNLSINQKTDYAGLHMNSQAANRGSQLMLSNGPVQNYNYSIDSGETFIVLEAVGPDMPYNPTNNWDVLGNKSRAFYDNVNEGYTTLTSGGMMAIFNTDNGNGDATNRPIGMGFRTRMPFWIIPNLTSGEDTVLIQSQAGRNTRLLVEDEAEFLGDVNIKGSGQAFSDNTSLSIINTNADGLSEIGLGGTQSPESYLGIQHFAGSTDALSPSVIGTGRNIMRFETNTSYANGGTQYISFEPGGYAEQELFRIAPNPNILTVSNSRLVVKDSLAQFDKGVYIPTTGKLGIGTDSPVRAAHILGDEVQMRIESNGTGGSDNWLEMITTSQSVNTANIIQFYRRGNASTDRHASIGMTKSSPDSTITITITNDGGSDGDKGFSFDMRNGRGTFQGEAYGEGNLNAQTLGLTLSAYTPAFTTNGTMVDVQRTKTGTGTPVGSLIPDFIGQTYVDTTTPGSEVVYFAVGVTNTSWKQISN